MRVKSDNTMYAMYVGGGLQQDDAHQKANREQMGKRGVPFFLRWEGIEQGKEGRKGT